MENRLLLVVVLQWLLCFGQDNPGIVLEVTGEGLDQLEALAQPILEKYILSLEPIDITPGASSGVDYKLNITHLALRGIGWTSIDLSVVPEQGISLALKGLSFQFDYTLTYHVTVPPLNGFVNTTGSVTNTDLYLTCNLFSVGGTPVAQFTSTSLRVGPIAFGLPGWLGDIAYILEPLLRGIFDLVLPGDIVPVVTEDLNDYLGTLPTQTFLPFSNNSVVIDLSMLSDPVFGQDLITVSLNGDIHAVGVPSCSQTPYPMDSISQRNFRVYFSQTVLTCFLLAYESTGYLNVLVNSLLQTGLPLNGQMGLSVDFEESSLLLVTQEGITYIFGLSVNLERTSFKPETFITVGVNVSSNVQISLVQNGSILLIPQFTAAQLRQFNVMGYAKDFPDLYKREIANTNFTVFASKANDLIIPLIPKLNENLQQGFALPPFVSSYLVEPELNLQSGYIVLASDIAS